MMMSCSVELYSEIRFRFQFDPSISVDGSCKLDPLLFFYLQLINRDD
jgi:hypothetical protein